MPPQDLQTLLALFLRDLYAGTVGLTSGVGLSLSDGTASANSGGLQFASETTLRFYRASAGAIRSTGSLSMTALAVDAAGSINFLTRGYLTALADGAWTLRNNGLTTGVSLKFDALPTIASGFGTTPSITAGSTPLAGSINVGTGGTATSGVIDFNGTAWPSAPFVVVTTKLTNAVTRVSAISTTQMTLTSTTAWTASDVISWCAIGAKA